MTNSSERLAFVQRVLEIFGEEVDEHNQLFWRVKDGQIHLFAMCNDLFWWATSDAEEITPDNLPILEQALVDLKTLRLPMTYLGTHLGSLFAARSRKMRPQRPCYKDMGPLLAALFDACGPERDPKDEG